MPDSRDREGGQSSAPEVQTSEGRKAVREDRRRQEQQRVERQKRLSILSWNAGPRRGIPDSIVGSFHVILVQEAETVCHDIATRAQQFHDNTRAPIRSFSATKTPLSQREDSGRDPGHIKAGLLWPETPLGQVEVREVAEAARTQLSPHT